MKTILLFLLLLMPVSALALDVDVDCGTGSTLTLYRWGAAGADTLGFGSVENGVPETWLQVNSGVQFNIPCSGIWQVHIEGYGAYFVVPDPASGGGSGFDENLLLGLAGLLCGAILAYVIAKTAL